MDKYINIGTPTLSPGDYFEVRYRKLPNGAWQDFGELTTQNFVLNGLSDGEYELEITYVLADGTKCTPTIINFSVDSDPPTPPVCDCLDLSNVYVNVDCDNIITIHADIATPLPDNCGIKITYSFNGGSDISVDYDNNTLPNPLIIPIQNANNVHLKVEVYCCGTETWKTCYDANIVDIRRCGCISPPEIINETITYNPNATSTYCVTFNGSNPNVPPYTITFQPIIGMPTVYTQNVPNQGTYCFNIPEGIRPSLGKWLTVVSNQCGQDSSTGL
jgi:hypothetical protein